MPNSDRMRIIFHGAVVLLVGLLCGVPTVTESLGGETERLWHTAHEGLIMIGIMLLAISSVMPMLRLEKREATGLVWSLLATGYGLMTGLILQGITGARAFGPTTSPVLMTAFIGNAVGMFGSVISASLTIMGARAGRRSAVASVRTA
jgi:uncharacterized YccA/Bax inhibitor family protein